MDDFLRVTDDKRTPRQARRGKLTTHRLMGKQLTGLNSLTLINLDSGSGRQVVNIEYLAVLIFDNNLWMLITFMLDYNGLTNLALTLLFDSDCFTFNNINKPYKAAYLG